MILRLMAALAGLLAIAASSPDQRLEERIAGFVSREAARANVKELVGYGPRMGGTASGDRAAAAVAGKMKELSLQIEVIEGNPIPAHEETSWSVNLGDRALASAWPYGWSPSMPSATVPLVVDQAEGPPRAPAGIKGAAVLTARPIQTVYDAMAAAGAAVLLTDAPRDPNRFTDWAPIEHLKAPDGSGSPKIPVFGISYRDGLLLRAAATDARPQTAPHDEARLTVSLDSRISRGRPRTVAGTLPGGGSRSHEVIIVCAHGDSDSGGPGADDNASGVASLLETARALFRAMSQGLLPSDRPAVRFIVWGAEYESPSDYVRSRRDEMKRLIAVINYDETGSGAERDAVYYEGNDIPWNATLLRTLEAVADDHAGKEGFWGAHTSVPSQGGTDAYVFLPKRYQGVGLTSETIPAITVFTAAWGSPVRLRQTPGWTSKGWPESGDLFVDYSAYYHSSGDTPGNTTEAEPYNMERCARLVAISIVRIMRGMGIMGGPARWDREAPPQADPSPRFER